MKNLALLFCALCVFISSSKGQAPSIEWAKCYGGSSSDIAKSIKRTSDNGFIIVGTASSNDGDVSGNHGSQDIWLVKVDSSGNFKWEKCLGGQWDETAEAVDTTKDGGFIIAGSADGNDGDVTGVNCSFSCPIGSDDFWVVKTDSFGNLQWQKCFGGTEVEVAKDVHQTKDGGYIVCGNTTSSNGQVIGHHGCNGCPADYWVIKLDSAGNFKWQKALGGNDYDNCSAIQETADSGFIVLGSVSGGNSGDISGYHGGSEDVWIVKLNSAGAIQWQKCLGGTGDEWAEDIVQSVDGNFFIAASTKSNDGDVSGLIGAEDFWLVKINDSGIIIWQKCFGGTSGWADSYSITPAIGSGALIAGYSNLNDGIALCSIPNTGFYDNYWCLKVDSLGDYEWAKCLGGSKEDIAYSVTTASDGGYVLVGKTQSNDVDVSGLHGAGSGNCNGGPPDPCPDYWIVKLAPESTNISETTIQPLDLTTHYNPATQNIEVKFFAKSSSKMLLQVVDVTGRELTVQELNVVEGFNRFAVGAGGFSAGFYFVRLEWESGFGVGKVMKN